MGNLYPAVRAVMGAVLALSLITAAGGVSALASPEGVIAGLIRT